MAVSERYKQLKETYAKAQEVHSKVKEVHAEYKKNYEHAEKVREIFHDNREELEEGSAEAFSGIEVGDLPKKPKFPWFILCVALVKDILDYLTLTGIGYVVALIVSILAGMIIFVWSWNKVRFKGMKAGIMKKVAGSKYATKFWTKFLILLGADFIPLVNLLPLETIFVLLAYYQEAKLVRLINLAFEIYDEKSIG
ncbi:MAG: hypothetical protein HZA36_01020 [Parcubacteria group bacterium]|nr:hypothetical protein [Parcubacteria group bacterium]